MKVLKGKLPMVGMAILLTVVMLGTALAQSPSDGLVPTVRVLVPNLSQTQAKIMPPDFSVGVMGLDPDSESNLPLKYRYLLASAQYNETSSIRTKTEYDQHGAGLLLWDDPAWSGWVDFPGDGMPPFIELAGLAADEYFLLALQVMDADGAVSLSLDYQLEVFNFQVKDGHYYPAVTLCEQYLGCTSNATSMTQIASGQPLNFSWIADAAAYGGTIVSYRHGWDLVDPNDPNDPGWAVPPGLDPDNYFAAERIFQEGLHSFYLQVVDNSGQVRNVTWQLSVVPFVSRDNQLELLLLDQTVDANSQAWPDQNGNPRDNQVYRNAYWEFLDDVSGGVSGFDLNRDRMDHTATPMYSDLVKYKAVLVYARNNVNQTLYGQLRPVNGQDKFVWLAPYQYMGGNFFQVGGNSMDSVLEESPYYMVPIIFDTNETSMVVGESVYILGFGQKENPDGSLTPRGPAMYPYATAGISAIDWTSPNTKTVYGRPQAARFDRKVDCVGIKGLVLDPGFRSNHSVAAGAIPDTFFTDQTIDWQDAADEAAGGLDLFAGTFPFRNDEFIDANISSRPTPIVPQECPSIPEAPGGMCVEPMFSGIARMDWMREEKWAAGDPGWPSSQYTDFELDDGCGILALTSYQAVPRSAARTNDQTYGYFSYKMIEDKPVRKADVYWGFDPYRFDQSETKKAIRWVLDYFGLNINP